MQGVLLIARLALAAVFVVAGAGKLADLAGSRRAVRAFGLPTWAAAPVGTLLPFAEIAVALTLLPARSAWWAALGALVLLALFCAGMGWALARGRRPDCHCFGQVYSEPVGWRALVRNAVIAAPAVLIVVAGRSHAGTDVLARIGGSAVSWIALGAGVVALLIGGAVLWLLLQLVAQNGRLLARLDALETRLAQGGAPAGVDSAAPAGPGLPIGAVAPGFSLTGLFGETLTLDALRAPGTPVLLGFVDPGCGPCTSLLPDLARWQKELAGTVTLALLSRGTVEENRAKIGTLGLTQMLLQHDREVAEAYQAYGTPSMVLVRPDGTVGSAVAAGAEAIRALVARTMGQPAPQPVIPVVQQQALQPAAQPGQPCPQCGKVHEPAAAPQQGGLAIGADAPAITLPDLDGRPVELSGPRGQETALLFWNPGCGFCQKLLPDLKNWEANRPDGSPFLIVISTGEKAANEAHGLISPVLLQEGFEAGTAFGVGGTPSAVLIDKAGKVASAPAVGGPAVMALLGGSGS